MEMGSRNCSPLDLVLRFVASMDIYDKAVDTSRRTKGNPILDTM